MDNSIETAIKNMADKITSSVDSGDALKFTQAALNLAHTKATLAGVKKEEDK